MLIYLKDILLSLIYLKLCDDEHNNDIEWRRRRKLQLQEEADLAYAIALSKAEAASLKQQ